MEDNVRRYPYWQATRSLLFWLPVFFLYFQAALPVEQVLLLEAVYYAGVVGLEVPSGYASDRWGRRPTLIVSACAALAAYASFFFATGFAVFVAAQLLFAVAISFNSGTDAALLYDSLLSLGRSDEYLRHEARGQSWAFGALSVAALVGGAAGGSSLRLPYALSALGAIAAVVIAIRFVEPTRSRARTPGRQLLGTAARLRDPVLRWAFALSVAMTVFVHVPYELFQPYVALAFPDLSAGYSTTPLIAGALVATMNAASSWAAQRAVAVEARLGARKAMLAALLAIVTLMGVLGIAVHPALALVLAIRSTPIAVLQPILGSVVHPRIDSSERATYFSLQSLAGRLAFAATLVVASQAVGGLDVLDAPAVLVLLRAFAGAGVACWILLALTGRRSAPSAA